MLRPYSVLPVILIGLFGSAAFAVGELPQTFTLDGQLSKVGTDDPLLDSSATIVVQILDPSKTCLLYEERQFINTVASEGYYSIQIGSNIGAVKRTASDPGRTMIQIFQNRSAITANSAPGETCAGGTYTPTAADSRNFRLIVTPSATGVADTLSPDTLMDSVPNALVAETLQGLIPDQFLQVGTGDLSQANVQTIFAAGNTAKLTTLLSVNPSNYVTKDSTNGTIQIPTASTPGTPLVGQIWYDSGVLKFWNGSAEQTLGVSGSGVTSVVAGTGLNVGAGPGGTISTSGTLNINVGATAGQIVQVQAGNKLPALSGADVTNLNGSAIQSGTIGGTTAISTSGNLQTSNDITSERLFLYDNGGVGPGFVGFKTVADIAGSGGSDYTLTLPNTAGGVGQVLRTDGAGILSWITPNSGSVTNVATGTGITGGPITGTGTIALANTTVTPNPYGSATQVATFTVDAQGRLTAASNVTISGVAPGGAASGDLSGNFPGPTVAKIQGKAVSATLPTAAGHVLRYDGTTEYVPAFLGITDIRSSMGPLYSAFFPLNCTAGQTLTWNVITDQMDCTNIGVSDSQVTYASKTQNTFLAAPNGSNGAPTFRAIATADLPSINSGISGTLPIANGGTGQITAPAAFNALSPMTTLGDTIFGDASGVGTRLAGNTTATKRFLTQTGDGTNSAAPAWGAIIAGDIPTLNQNTTGTATNVTGTVAIANGGTGATSQQAAINALAGGVSSAQFLRGNGTNVVMAAISASDVPTLNQNTTGSAAKWTTARDLAGNSVDGSANVAFSNKFIVQGTADAGLSGAQFLGSLGTGIVKNTTTTGVLSIAVAGDFPTLNQNTTGTAANVTGTVAVANGGTGVTSLPGTFVLNGGQAGAVTLGPSDATALTLNTSGSPQMTILSGGNVGIGTTTPNQLLTVEGVTSLRETTAPTLTANYGKIYVKSSDSKLYFMNDAGAETDLLAPGGVTSVDVTMPSIFSVTGGPVTTSGTIAATLANQNANMVFAGPASGGATAPTFRALASDDIPNLDMAKITTGVLAVANGGTGVASLTDNRLILGNGTAGVGVLAAGSAGQILRSGGASDPAWSTATYPATGGTVGTVLRSDGTNFVNTTASYPNTITAQGLLFGSATNVVGQISGTAAPSVLLTAAGTNDPEWSVGSNNTFLKGSAGGVSFSAVDLSTADVTGTLPESKGGTGTTSLSGAFVMKDGQNGAFTLGTNDANVLTLETNNSPALTILSSGNVGIGTASPAAKLDVAGGVRFGTTATCTATEEGTQRYNSTTKKMEYCNGTSWVGMGGSGSNALSDCATGNTNDVMVQVGSWCVDKYEASVWSSADGSGTGYFTDSTTGGDTQANMPTGATNYPASCNRNGAGCTEYAVSKPGVTPSRGLTWYQAARFCANAGKVMIPDDVWQVAAMGTVDPGAGTGTGGSAGGSATDAAAAQCNINTHNATWATWLKPNNGVRPTNRAGATSSSANACISDFGVEDMVGNLWEWTSMNSAQAGIKSVAFTQGEFKAAGNPFSTDDGSWNVNGSAYGCDGAGTALGTCGWKDNVVAAARRGGFLELWSERWGDRAPSEPLGVLFELDFRLPLCAPPLAYNKLNCDIGPQLQAAA